MEESKEPEEIKETTTPIDSDLNDELNKIDNLELETIKTYLNDSPSKLVPSESPLDSNQTVTTTTSADTTVASPQVKSHSYSLKSRTNRNFNIFKRSPLIASNSLKNASKSSASSQSASSPSSFASAKTKIVDNLVNKSNYEIIVQGEKVRYNGIFWLIL